MFYTNNYYDNNSDMRIDFDVTSMDQKEAQEALLKLELRKTQLELASKARDSFITFVKTVWPGSWKVNTISELVRSLKRYYRVKLKD